MWRATLVLFVLCILSAVQPSGSQEPSADGAPTYSRQEAWQAFHQGIGLLEKGAPREEVLAHWQETLKVHGQSPYGDQLRDYVAELKKQVEEDKELAAAEVQEPENLPEEEQIAYYLARFPDMRGVQISQPGHCLTVGLGDRTKFSDAVVKIGRPAVPALIERLSDRRLTRSIGFWRDFAPSRTVLRVQDVAVQCIERILDKRFYRPRTTSSYFSTEPPEVRQRIVAEIKTWWKEYGNKPPLEGYLAQLEQGPTRERLEALKKIEAIDPTAVDGVAVLRRLSHDFDMLPVIAAELERRGDNSFLMHLPAIRRLVRHPHRDIDVDWLSFLLQYGDEDDYRFLREAARREMDLGAQAESRRRFEGVYTCLEGTTNPLVVPILFDGLHQRKITGSRWLVVDGEGKGVGFSRADRCMEALVRITGHDEGYRPADPEKQRFAAIDRWLDWWRKEGKDSFVEKHPDVLKVLGETDEKIDTLDPATLPRLVRVEIPERQIPVAFEIPRSAMPVLVQAGAIEARRNHQGEAYFQFASHEAALKWFSKAKPVQEPGADAAELPAMRVSVSSRGAGPWPDSLGRMWCTWRVAGSPTAVFDGKIWTTYTEPFAGREEHQFKSFIAAFPGADGAMVFEDDQYHFHLFDAEGWVNAESAPALARSHPERLRRALAYPPQHHGDNFYHHLVKDGKGQIWWSRWEDSWGAFDGQRAIEGDASGLGVGPDRGRTLVVLFPVGDEGRVLVGREDGPAAIVEVQDGRLAKVDDAPFSARDTPRQTHWSLKYLRDHAGRVWVQTGEQSVALSPDGRKVDQRAGRVLLEDRRQGLWFYERNPESQLLARRDRDGGESRLALSDASLLSLAEGADDTVWALTTSHLLRLRPAEPQLTVVEKYLASGKGQVWCDPEGRVWRRYEEEDESILMRYATPASTERVLE